MTVGQRIAQKRMELELSPAILSTRLDIAPQTVYDWENDIALPNVSDLITLSKFFSVSTSWLLGIEESDVELTEEQLTQLLEVVNPYLATEPKKVPAAPTYKKWVRPLLCIFLIALLVLLWNLFQSIQRLQNDSSNLSNSITQMQQSFSNQIGDITNQVTHILEQQNQLISQYDVLITSMDLTDNTVTFAVSATPKTYIDGMTATFTADTGEGNAVTADAALGANQTFSAQITCPLTDHISIQVFLKSGDTQETQLLEEFYSLYADTFPKADIVDSLWGSTKTGKDGRFQFSDTHVDVFLSSNSTPSVNESAPAYPKLQSIRVGLFRNQKLVAWYEPDKTDPLPQDMLSYHLPNDLWLEPDGVYRTAAVLTDTIGREYVVPSDSAVEYSADENFTDHCDTVPDGEWEY